jgi:hypothetical protein
MYVGYVGVTGDRMQMKSLAIKPKQGQSVNKIVDFIFDNAPTLPEDVDTFEIIEGASSLFGAGDNAAIALIIKYTEEHISDEARKAIQAIIKLAQDSGGEYEIIFTDAA